MPRKYATGRKAWFICQRCGQRGLYRNSKFDGYYPNLRVHPECWEDKHPQTNLPKVSDPIALWRPSPEWGGEPPVLSGEADPPTDTFPTITTQADGIFQDLIWTNANFAATGDPVSYTLYRLDSLTFESGFQFSDPGSLTVSDIIDFGVLVDTFAFGIVTYDDDAVNNLTVQYAYFIQANASDAATLDSNITFSNAPS